MTSLKELVDHWSGQFKTVGLTTPDLDARTLVLFAADLTLADLIADPGKELTKAQTERVAELCHRRLKGEPLAYVTGEKEFWSLPFKVTPDTLIPRPDTETLVTLGLKALPDPDGDYRILDFGTGSGCLLLALLNERPRSTGLGIDLSEGAVAVARENALNLGLDARGHFQVGNWGEGLDGAFDLIVSNPPYIRDGDPDVAEDVRAFEPSGALYGGADGLDPLRALIPHVRRLLREDGSYIMEYGLGQTAMVTEIVTSGGIEIAEIGRDLAGIERAVVAKVAKM